MEFEILLRIIQVLGLPAMGGLIWLWREIANGKKEIEVLKNRQLTLEQKTDNLPGHKLYAELQKAISEMSKMSAVQNERLIGILNTHQAENVVSFRKVTEDIGELKESRLRHDQILSERVK